MMPFTSIINFDVSDIKKSLEYCDDLWDEHSLRRASPGSPHSEMTDIWARFGSVEDGDYSQLGTPHSAVWYPCIDRIKGLKRVAFQLMALVNGEQLGGILITKLPSGAKIAPHIDQGWHAGFYEKFYLSINSPKGSYFGFEDGRIDAKEGDCYWFRNDVLHWVENPTDEERISIIICIKTDIFEHLK